MKLINFQLNWQGKKEKNYKYLEWYNIYYFIFYVLENGNKYFMNNFILIYLKKQINWKNVFNDINYYILFKNKWII